MFEFLKKKLKENIKKLKSKVERKLTEKEFEEAFFPFEISLLENNVSQEVVERIKEGLKKELVGEKKGRTSRRIKSSLKKVFDEILMEGELKIDKKPFVILFVGVNGVGKTTAIAKLAYLLKKKGLSCVLSASDTFRAASIEQLEKHGEKLGMRVIKHQYGADGAAVAYDAIEYAKKHGIDVVLIDTAGRMHSNKNLMDELRKIKRVAKPDYTIFVGDALTGNDAVEQARRFNEEVGIDGIILTKADVDRKGGAVISVSYATKKPILYLGVGQDYKDLKPFRKEKIIEMLCGKD